MDFWEEDHRGQVLFLSPVIKALYYYHDLSLLMLTLITWCLSGSFSVKLLFSPLKTVLFERKSSCTTHNPVEDLSSTSLRVKYYTNYLEFFCTGNLSVFPYYFIQLFIYVSLNSWVFFSYLGYNLVRLYSFYCLNCSSYDHWDLFHLTLVSL